MPTQQPQLDARGRRIPDFAPPLSSLTPHPFNREPHCQWCEDCFRFEDDEIHRVEAAPAPVKGSQECPCQTQPLESRCGVWEGNESACLCADNGIAIGTGLSLPG